jgi:diacylglycerol O-acyltransferase / wax synthase
MSLYGLFTLVSATLHSLLSVVQRPWTGQDRRVANPDRLTALDAAFLHLEDAGPAHMHVAAVFVFTGEPPAYDDLCDALEARLALVPRYRQKLAPVPLGQGRPTWIDDPHFNIRYHVRHSALPAPGDEAALKRLAGRAFAQRLDRNKPLWEVHLVEGLQGDRFALVSKTHHALVDGISGVDITSVLFSASPDEHPEPAGDAWVPRPEPPAAQRLADALVERATVPYEVVRGVRRATRAPRRALGRVGGLASLLGVARAAPPSPLNVPVGPHRRYTWVDAELATVKATKDALGGTVNDVVLTSVALGLGRFLRGRGHPTRGLVLRAMVPVSVRADEERGALGNRVAAMYAPLPVGEEDPVACFDVVHAAMGGLKESGQAVGAETLTRLGDFAPPTVLSQAARVIGRQRMFNVVVTNVPGPQLPLYLLGRELESIFPVVPLAENTALGIAIMSYNGRLGYGLLGDYDALPDLEDAGAALQSALDDLARAAGVRPGRPRLRTARSRAAR